MQYNTIDRNEFKEVVTGGNTYLYIEFPVTQQESIYGFHIEIESTALRGATSTTDVLVGLSSMDPLAEVAANTVYNVNAGAAGKRILGAITLDFQAQVVNKIFVDPGTVLGGVTFPGNLPPVMGLYIRDSGIKIKSFKKSRAG